MNSTGSDSLQAERVPVSRIQRFLPFLSYSLMGLGGAAAGYYVLRVVGEFQDTETAGIGRIASWLSSGMWSVTTGLVLAMIVGFIAIIVHAAMMFAQKKSASPPAWTLLLVAFIGMLAPALGWPAVMDLLVAPFEHNLDPHQLAATSKMYLIPAIIFGTLTPVVGLVLTFVPLKSRPGKKAGTLIVMIVIEVLMLAAFVYVTMEARSIMKMAMSF